MKKRLLSLLLVLVLVVALVPVSASAMSDSGTVQYDDSYFNYQVYEEDGFEFAFISGYYGAHEVSIPAYINDIPVMGIGEQAFANMGITEVAIPFTVVMIRDDAFLGCKLKNVYYLGSAEMWKQIDIGSSNSELKNANRYYLYPTVTTGNDAATGKITLKWKTIPLDGISYVVYRAYSKNGTYYKMGTTTKGSYTNTGAKAGTTYYYKVVLDPDGTDMPLELATPVSRTCDLPRPVVTSGNNAETGKNTLKWKAIDGAKSYTVYRAGTKDGTYTKMYTTTGTSYTNSSAGAGYTYYYKVVANSSKTEYANSAYSLPVSRTCDLPRPVVTSGNDAATGHVKLTWKAIDGAKNYSVYRADSKDGEYTRVYTTVYKSYIDKSSEAGKTYYYKVVANSSRSQYANSAYSAVVSRTTDCAKPVVTAQSVNAKAKLTWSPVDGATKYVIYRAVGNGSFSKYDTTSGTTYTNMSVKVGTTYSYKIVAVSDASKYADSAYSAPATVKIVKAEPTTPPSSTPTKDLNDNPDGTVWIPTNGGIKYHSNPSCSQMENPVKKTVDEATALGYTPCQRCFG